MPILVFLGMRDWVPNFVSKWHRPLEVAMSMQKLRAALVAIVPQVSREDSTSHAGKHARPSILKKDHKVNVVEEHGQDSDQHGEDEEQRDDADEDDPYRLEEQAQVLMTEAARRRHRMRR